MPDDEDGLALEGLLSLVDVLREELTVVRNFRPHVVDEEGLGEVIFVIRVRHRLEVQGHGCATLDIPNFVGACGRVAVAVEELGDVLAVLGEERVVTAGLPLLIVVHHVVGLWAEETAELLVLEDAVKDVNLVDGGLSSLVPDPGTSDEDGVEEVNFPQPGVGEHQEGEATVSHEGAGIHVVVALHASAGLVDVVTSAKAPFPVVRVDHVGHVVELRWVSLSFDLFGQTNSL